MTSRFLGDEHLGCYVVDGVSRHAHDNERTEGKEGGYPSSDQGIQPTREVNSKGAKGRAPATGARLL